MDGQIQLTVMPFLPNSTAKERVKPITPCLADVYGECIGEAPKPSVEEIFTILGVLDFSINGRHSLIRIA